MTEHRMEQTSHEASDDRCYSERLRRLILSSLTSEGLPLSRIVRAAGGAYPTDVREVLDKIVASGIVNQEDEAYRLTHARAGRSFSGGLIAYQEACDTSNDVSSQFNLADPHPADYDWRFSQSALGNLAERLQTFIDGGAQIALFGTTTLFAKLAAAGAAVTLFDKSPSLIRDLDTAGFKCGLVEHDLFDPIADSFGKFHVVVADPPWYPAFHRAFMLRGTEVLQQGGLLLLSVLPWLTRPSAVADRADILAFARQCGLDLAEASAGFLAYQSPKFEKIALALHGVHCGNWRAGDLFVFRKVDEPSQMLEAPRPEDEPTWEEYRIGNRKIKLRLRPNDRSSRFNVKSASGTGRYVISVSRRSPVRDRIDIWTSDNVAYEVEGLDTLRYSLARMASGDSQASTVEDTAKKYQLTSDEESVLSNLLTEIAGEAVDWFQ